jgi:transposase
MSKVKELFGHSKYDDMNWNTALHEQKCPYTNKTCFKVRKSNPSISIGVCTVNYSKYDAVMICPHRLLERRQIFIDCVHLLSLHEPGNELHLISEGKIPGGYVDYFLVSVYKNKVVDFVGIELQTLDTTGSIWSERAEFIKERGLSVNKDDLMIKKFGMNWKMSAKTILFQMHHKAGTFEHLNKHFVLIVQDFFLDYMRREFCFSHFHQHARQGDSVHIHTYSLDKTKEKSYRLEMKERISTDVNGIALCLELQAEAKIELKKIIEYLETRISGNTLLKIV